jgi:hypothetical protein
VKTSRRGGHRIVTSLPRLSVLEKQVELRKAINEEIRIMVLPIQNKERFHSSTTPLIKALHSSRHQISLSVLDFILISRIREMGSRDSSVGIATGYEPYKRGRSSSPNRVKNFHFSTSSSPAMGSTQPPIQWVPVALSPGVKQPRGETDHTPPISAEVRKTWICTTTPPYAFMA